jgi:hypothetical protein
MLEDVCRFEHKSAGAEGDCEVVEESDLGSSASRTTVMANSGSHREQDMTWPGIQ